MRDKNNKQLPYIFASFMIAFIPYIILSFIYLEFNPVLWTLLGRVILGIFAFISGIFITAFIVEPPREL